MSLKEARAIYEQLLEAGDLFDLYPGLSGVWKEDKNNFKRQYDLNREFLSEEFNINSEDEYSEYWD
jgi:hypothetical protein